MLKSHSHFGGVHPIHVPASNHCTSVTPTILHARMNSRRVLSCSVLPYALFVCVVLMRGSGFNGCLLCIALLDAVFRERSSRTTCRSATQTQKHEFKPCPRIQYQTHAPSILHRQSHSLPTTAHSCKRTKLGRVGCHGIAVRRGHKLTGGGATAQWTVAPQLG